MQIKTYQRALFFCFVERALHRINATYKFTVSHCTTESYISYSLRLSCFYKCSILTSMDSLFTTALLPIKFMVCGKSLSVSGECIKLFNIPLPKL